MITTDFFKQVTGVDIFDFFLNVTKFIDEKQNAIIDYYSGENLIDKSAFNSLDNYIDQAKHISDLFWINRNVLSTDTLMWDLIDSFENVQTKLLTLKNTPRWLRSSFSKDFEKKDNVDFTLTQNTTLEDVTRHLGYSQFNDEWFQLAIKNSLMESDYDLDGGNLLKVTIKSETFSDVTSVVDVLTGENVLGKDITTKIEFGDDDIKALSPRDTFFQAVNILVLLRKNFNPQFPDHGIPIFEGSNRNSVEASFVYQNLVDSIKNDDTIKEIELLDSSTDGDKINLKLKIVSKFADIKVQKQISI